MAGNNETAKNFDNGNLGKRCEKENNLEDIYFDLRNLFEIPNLMLEEIVKSQHSNIKLGVSKGTSHQHEKRSISEHLSHDKKKSLISNETDKVLSDSTTEHTQVTSKSSNDSFTDFFECDQISLSPDDSKHSINVEIHNMPIDQAAETDSLNSAVMVDFRIVTPSNQESEIIVISDDDDDYESGIEKVNDDTKNNSLDNCNMPTKVFKKKYNNQTSKTLLTLNKGCTRNISKTLKSSANSCHSLKIKVCNLSKPANKQLIRKLETISTTQNISDLKAPTFKCFLPKMNHIIKSFLYPSLNCKVYKTSSTQFVKSEDQLQSQIKNNAISQENVKPATVNHLAHNSETILNNNKRPITDFTKNILETGKDIIQGIQGAVFKTLKSFSCENSLSDTERKTENNNKQNVHFHIKLRICNPSPPQETDEQLSINSSSNKQTFYKFNKSERTNNNSGPKVGNHTQAPVQMANRLPQVTKSKYSSLRRQLELHRLRVQVEQRRLRILDLKLAREMEEMQRQKFIFEKYFLPNSFQFKTLDDTVEV